jgi:Protein of unknown function (DUF3455)
MLSRPSIPSSIASSAEEELVLIAQARGFQIYLCGPAGWVLKAPEAVLYDQQGNIIGRHFAGPTWQHNDGSQITAKLAAKAEAPDSAAIPWLLLKVTGHSGAGIFSRVTSIQRINTVGGLPPATACTQAEHGNQFQSPYSADYYFYVK